MLTSKTQHSTELNRFGQRCQLLTGKLGRGRDADTLKVTLSLPTCATLCMPDKLDPKLRLSQNVSNCFPPDGTNAAKALVFEQVVLGEVPIHLYGKT